MTDTLYSNESKCIGYFHKIDPSKPWSKIRVEIEAIKRVYGSSSGFSNNRTSYPSSDGKVNSLINLGFKINVLESNGNTVHISDSGKVSISASTFTVSCIKCKTE